MELTGSNGLLIDCWVFHVVSAANATFTAKFLMDAYLEANKETVKHFNFERASIYFMLRNHFTKNIFII